MSHASRGLLDSQSTWMMETGLKEKQEAHMLSKHCQSYYPPSWLPASSREKAVKPLFIRNIPIDKCNL